MAYRLLILPAAIKVMKKNPEPDRSRIGKRIEGLAAALRFPGAVKLSNKSDLYRVRAGDYRIIYRIEDKNLIVLVVRVGHRKEIYKKLKS